MRILCVSAQLPGHLDWGGYLATAALLHQQGHVVLWATGQDLQPLVTARDLPFHALHETGWRWPPPAPLPADLGLSEAQLRRLRGERALDQWLDMTRVEPATVELIELGRQFQPDLLLTETFVSAAGLAAEALGAPLVVMGWPAFAPRPSTGDDPLIREARGRLQSLLARFGLRGVNWTASGAPALLSPHLHLTYWSPRWYAGLSLLPQTQHVGGVAPSPTSPPWPTHDPWVLITLGTSFGNDPNFFLAAAHAAAQIGCLPILVLGGQLTVKQVQPLRKRLPAKYVMEEHIDFSSVLPYLSAAIQHGGAGSTHALVTHAVPQIVVPHAADQAYQAQGVVRSGVGLHIPAKEVTIERLVHGLAQLLPDLSKVRENARLLRAEFASLGGVAKASALIDSVLTS
jgi:hypothetical protein